MPYLTVGTLARPLGVGSDTGAAEPTTERFHGASGGEVYERARGGDEYPESHTHVLLPMLVVKPFSQAPPPPDEVTEAPDELPPWRTRSSTHPARSRILLMCFARPRIRVPTRPSEICSSM